MKKQLLIWGLILSSFSAYSQSATSIVMFNINYVDARLHLGKQTRITDRFGYDNQPHFSPDGQSIFHFHTQQAASRYLPI